VSWLDDNDRYLEAELALVRSRLARLAPPAAPAAAAAPAKRRLRRRQESPGPRLLPMRTTEPLAEAIERRDRAAAIDPAPALWLLAARLGLTAFERDVLMLCIAAELDPGLRAQIAAAGFEGGHPTFGLALALLDDPAWEALSAQRPLRHFRLVELTGSDSLALTAAPLRADERAVSFAKGINAIDDRLAALLEPVGAAELAPSQVAAVGQLLARLHAGASGTAVPVVQLAGADAALRQAVAQRAAAELERELHRVAGELPDEAVRLWERETMLLPVALLVEVEEVTPALRRLLGHGGLAFASSAEPLRLGVPSFTVEVRRPAPGEQRAAWSQVAGDEEADALAGQFDLALHDIQRVAAAAGDGGLWTGCRELTRPRLEALAQRLEPKATWDDLVLGGEAVGLLRQLTGQVRRRHRVYEDWGFAQRMNRGFGISALFAGESGTGKTMAAEVIANELGLDLYRIDLSGVVSKYIGETEKNLRRLFDAAEAGGAILLFDEADALFGKRSEVKDSHDRYANIEIDYLLQRIEGFTGLAILTTNLKSALDTAFTRRLRFVVDFPFPGTPEREAMWRRALPAEVPVEELDYGRLGRLGLTGGAIHNIALNAAFIAAQDGGVVRMPALLEATRMELRKLERPFHEAELR
jgi:ATPase family associated with various cellular activities (AAA)/Winged helix domain, variant